MARKWAVILLECAWILWAEATMHGEPGVRWHIANTWPTHRECMADLQHIRQVSKEKGEKVDGPFIEQVIKGYTIRTQLKCVPDSIDPRGPK